MAHEIDRMFSRVELAERLEELAAGLRAGEMQTDGRAFHIPDSLEAKIACKEKKGRIIFKLRWRWPTLDDYAPGEQEAVRRWQDSMKTVKKRLGRSFKALRRAAGAPGGPDSGTLTPFVEDSRAFAEMADAEWSDGMRPYMDHLDNLVRAVEEGRLETVRHEIRDLEEQMRVCHRRFK